MTTGRVKSAAAVITPSGQAKDKRNKWPQFYSLPIYINYLLDTTVDYTTLTKTTRIYTGIVKRLNRIFN